MGRITNSGQHTTCKQCVIDNFVEFVNVTISLCNVSKENVVNIDGMNINFSVSLIAVDAEKNSKTILANQANTSNWTIGFLGVTQDIGKLKPLLMFNRIRTDRERVDKDLKYRNDYSSNLEYDC